MDNTGLDHQNFEKDQTSSQNVDTELTCDSLHAQLPEEEKEIHRGIMQPCPEGKGDKPEEKKNQEQPCLTKQPDDDELEMMAGAVRRLNALARASNPETQNENVLIFASGRNQASADKNRKVNQAALDRMYGNENSDQVTPKIAHIFQCAEDENQRPMEKKQEKYVFEADSDDDELENELDYIADLKSQAILAMTYGKTTHHFFTNIGLHREFLDGDELSKACTCGPRDGNTAVQFSLKEKPAKDGTGELHTSDPPNPSNVQLRMKCSLTEEEHATLRAKEDLKILKEGRWRTRQSEANRYPLQVITPYGPITEVAMNRTRLDRMNGIK